MEAAPRGGFFHAGAMPRLLPVQASSACTSRLVTKKFIRLRPNKCMASLDWSTVIC